MRLKKTKRSFKSSRGSHFIFLRYKNAKYFVVMYSKQRIYEYIRHHKVCIELIKFVAHPVCISKDTPKTHIDCRTDMRPTAGLV